MKLIDLLVQELPKLGGWPIGVKSINQAHDGQLEDYSSCCDSYSLYRGISFPLSDNYRLEANCVSECSADFVTREQYEAALAASKQIEWNGRGLPPVGAECEFFNGDRFDCRQSVPKDGTKVKIVAHEESEIGIECAVFTWTCMDGALHAEACTARLFRPIRTEAERRRDESARSLCDHLEDLTDWDSPVGKAHALAIYDAIAAGKIPGVKLAD